MCKTKKVEQPGLWSLAIEFDLGGLAEATLNYRSAPHRSVIVPPRSSNFPRLTAFAG
jgi:hypothetical protein